MTWKAGCWEVKPTNHKEACHLCKEPVLKGQERLRIHFFAWRASATLSVCLECIRKKAAEMSWKTRYTGD